MVFVKGVLERKKFQIFLAKTDAHVRWVVKEKSFRFFRPNGDFAPVGSDEKKVSDLFGQNRGFCQGGTGG